MKSDYVFSKGWVGCAFLVSEYLDASEMMNNTNTCFGPAKTVALDADGFLPVLLRSSLFELKYDMTKGSINKYKIN